ncbi:MAG TPA: hypothetical protein EYN89_11445 [Flavobacteriales bacterium]|nr:hypothetical protein [Flavobacteriales bacterium]
MKYWLLRQPLFKRLLTFTCTCGLIIAWNTICLSSTQSKETGALSEPIKTFIEENLNKKIWYGIYLKDKKYGYASHVFAKDAKHNYLIETLNLVLKQKEENKNFTTTITMKQYFNLITGEFLKCSNENDESAANVRSVNSATVVDDFLVVQSPKGTKTKLPWSKNYNLQMYLNSIMWVRSNPEIGSRITSLEIDCATGKAERIENKLIEKKQTLIGGKKVKKYTVLLKYEDLGEMQGTVLSDGTTIEFSIGPLKLFLEPEKVAQSDINFFNINETASLKIKEPIKDYQKLSLLKLKISSSPPIDIKNSFQQITKKNKDGSYSISLGSKTQYREKFDPTAYAKELQGTAKYPIKSPTITALVKEILNGAKTDNEKVWRLLAFVSNTLIDDYMANSEDALEIMNRHKGDCTEHAILFTTLARAAGIPAREALGLVYNDVDKAPGFGAHAWAEVALGGEWIGLDPTWRERVIEPIRIKTAGFDYIKINKIEIVEKSYSYQAPDNIKKPASDAYKKKDYKKSFSLYQPLAEKGDYYSQYSLGWAFQHGKGVTKDYKKAYDWYLKAAQQGDSNAEYSIGDLYTDEKWLGNNPTLAAFWFERSALGDNDLAAYFLAEAYETGAGMPKNKDVAIKWYKSAASSVFN